MSQNLSTALSRFGTVPVMDIISFGLRWVFEHLKPMFILSLPIVFYNALVGAGSSTVYIFNPSLQSGSITGDSMFFIVMSFFLMMLSFVGYFGMSYLMYVFLKYIVDWFNGEVKANMWDYYVPEKRLVGWVGFILIYIVASIVAVIMLIFGFLLLVIPGLVMLVGLVYLYLRFLLAPVIYFLEPEKGVLDSFSQSWRLVNHDQIWRALGLVSMLFVIVVAISLPFSVIQGVTSFMSGLGSATMLASLSAPVIFALMFISQFMVFAVQVLIATNGGFVINTRFYCDLIHRLQAPPFAIENES